MFKELSLFSESYIDSYLKETEKTSDLKMQEDHEEFVNSTYKKFKDQIEHIVMYQDKSKEKVTMRIKTKIDLEYFKINRKQTYTLRLMPESNSDIELLVLRSQWRGAAQATKQVVEYVLNATNKDKTIIGSNSKQNVGTTGKSVASDKEADTKIDIYYFEPSNADIKFFNEIGRFKW